MAALADALAPLTSDEPLTALQRFELIHLVCANAPRSERLQTRNHYLIQEAKRIEAETHAERAAILARRIEAFEQMDKFQSHDRRWDNLRLAAATGLVLPRFRQLQDVLSSMQ